MLKVEEIYDPNEDFIKQFMRSCRYFTGVTKKQCEKSMVYKDMWGDGKTLSCLNGIGAIKGNEKCPHRDFPTREEALEYLERADIRTKAILDGKCPDCGKELIDLTIKDGYHKGHGQMVCDVCRETKVWI